MKVQAPSPSQAAVVLKRFANEQGCTFKLSQAQEAVARMYGYASWNAMAADIDTRKPGRVEKEKLAPAQIFAQWSAKENEPCTQVEWDPAFWGGDYDDVGDFAYIADSLVDALAQNAQLNGADPLDVAFELVTGEDAVHIIHIESDEKFTSSGEPVQEELDFEQD